MDKNQIEQILVEMQKEDIERFNKRMAEKSKTRKDRKGKRLHVEKLMRSCKGYNIFEKLINYDTYSFRRGCRILTYIEPSFFYIEEKTEKEYWGRATIEEVKDEWKDYDNIWVDKSYDEDGRVCAIYNIFKKYEVTFLNESKDILFTLVWKDPESMFAPVDELYEWRFFKKVYEKWQEDTLENVFKRTFPLVTRESRSIKSVDDINKYKKYKRLIDRSKWYDKKEIFLKNRIREKRELLKVRGLTADEAEDVDLMFYRKDSAEYIY